MNDLSDADVLAAIRSGEDAGLATVYRKYREPCLRFLLARVIDKDRTNRPELAAELFSESLIILTRNVKSGRLTELSARLDTYLNAVSRNLYLKHRRRRGRIDYYAPQELPSPLVEPEPETDADLVRKILYARIRELGPKCRRLLAHFYFLELDWESISEILGYKNAASAKNNKAKCMVRLRALYGITKPSKLS